MPRILKKLLGEIVAGYFVSWIGFICVGSVFEVVPVSVEIGPGAG